MIMTRRQFIARTRALGARARRRLLPGNCSFIVDALAQAPSAADLAKPGPLGDVVMGKADAPVTIIEYASMTCGHCATFHNTTYPELKKKYIDTGKVKYILREFPLDPLAAAGFMLARCAGERQVLSDGRNAVSEAERMGGAAADPAAARDRQAGRLHAGKVRNLPVGPENPRRHRSACARTAPKSLGSIPRRLSSSTAR